MTEFMAKNIRNIALIGHGGEGKTTLAEAILFNAQAIDRQGTIDAGNTTMDYDPEEIAKKSSISLSIANCVYEGYKFNIIDVPGFFDFEGEMVQALTVAGSAIVVCGPTGSVSVGTEKALDYCIEKKIPAMVFINGMDKENANYLGTVHALHEKYGSKIAPLQIPKMVDQKMKGYINVAEGLLYEFGNHGTNGQPIPPELQAEYEDVRSGLIENAVESDDELLTKYFDGIELTQEEIAYGLRKGLTAGTAIPVLAGSALTNRGIFNLMGQIIECSPSPEDSKPIPAKTEDGKEEVVRCSEDGPVVLRVFKTIVDPFVGKMNLFKVLRGCLKAGMTLRNPNKEIEEKVGSLYFIRGKKQEATNVVHAGDIAAVAKLQDTSTGDSLCDIADVVVLPALEIPKPVLSMAVYAAKKDEAEKIFAGLHRLQDEDISFTVTKNPETGEMLLNGIGNAQLEILVRKLKNKFGVDAILKEPRIPYRETITKTVEAEGKHKKQSGGAGQYGHCWIRFEPCPEEDFVFADEVVGGTVPKQYIPAVEKGLRESITKGVLAGYPMVNLKAVLYDGSYHPVDSKEIAFVTAASLAYKDGCARANPVLLEPIYSLKVTAPAAYMGDIMGDITKRRGRVTGIETEKDKQIISGEVPLSEILQYATDLRSMTQGRGKFEMEFVRYEEVPQMLVPKIVEDAKKRTE